MVVTLCFQARYLIDVDDDSKMSLKDLVASLKDTDTRVSSKVQSSNISHITPHISLEVKDISQITQHKP